MTANEPEDSTAEGSTETDTDDTHLLDGERAAGIVMGEAVFAPEDAAVAVEEKGDFVSVRVREGTNSRGLSATWVLEPADARLVADRLATVAADVENRPEGDCGD